MSKPSKEITEKPAASVPTAIVEQLREEANAGFEGATSRDDFAIPFLVILQPLSPQLQPGNAEFIEDARPGMILNTVTRELATAVRVIPVRYTRTFTEWVPRDAGGGFRGERGADAVEEFDRLRDPTTGRAKLPNGNDLVDTRNFYVLIIDDKDMPSPAIVSMSSTQIRKARQWMQIMNGTMLPGRDGRAFRPPMYSSVFILTSSQQENKKGKWYGWSIRRHGFVQDTDQYQSASLFNKQISVNAITVDRNQAAADGSVIDGDEI